MNNGIRFHLVGLDGSIVRDGLTRTPASRMVLDFGSPGAREFIADMKAFDSMADDPLLIYREKKQ